MAAPSCDIFCKVIDNYGDIGVCWRLTRQLVQEHGLAVRLWVDDLTSFSHIAPTINPELDEQSAAGVTIHRWNDAAAHATPADIVIEAFACNPPETYIQAMALSGRRHAWINLEYLSAEAWVEDCHAIASPHPRLPLTRYFYFPGFTFRTGGLLKEARLEAERGAFLADAAAQIDFWQRLQTIPPPAEALKISLFGYENAALPSLLDAWTIGAKPIHAILPEGRLKAGAENWAGRTLKPGDLIERGALRLHITPFMHQEDYDRLLWLCDLNFVRGEDSFVRAQWAHKPLIWHIYQQEDDIHRVKLDAFLARYAVSLCAPTSEALQTFWHIWDRQHDAGAAWVALELQLPALTRHAHQWAEEMQLHGDLSSKLLIFCENLLQ